MSKMSEFGSEEEGEALSRRWRAGQRQRHAVGVASGQTCEQQEGLI